MASKVSTTTAVLVLVLVVIVLMVLTRRSSAAAAAKKEGFERTCMTAAGNCTFVRTPVDYVYRTSTEVPTKIGRDYPHYVGNPTDKAQPLEDGYIDLEKDMRKLENPELLWKQYGNDWTGCGNGKPYIVNDEKTRSQLADTGDIWATRQLYAMRTPAHGPVGRYPALTEQDEVVLDPFDRSYGGSFLPQHIGN
jgi:hypothetical protein